MRNIDKISLENAFRLFDTEDISKIEIGTLKGLKDIHIYLFINKKMKLTQHYFKK